MKGVLFVLSVLLALSLGAALPTVTLRKRPITLESLQAAQQRLQVARQNQLTAANEGEDIPLLDYLDAQVSSI